MQRKKKQREEKGVGTQSSALVSDLSNLSLLNVRRRLVESDGGGCERIWVLSEQRGILLGQLFFSSQGHFLRMN